MITISKNNYIKLENKYHSKVYTKYEYSKNWWLSIDGEHCNNWWLKRNTSNMFYTHFMITISNWKTKNTKGEYCNNVNTIVSIKICIFWVVIFFFFARLDSAAKRIRLICYRTEKHTTKTTAYVFDIFKIVEIFAGILHSMHSHFCKKNVDLENEVHMYLTLLLRSWFLFFRLQRKYFIH